MCYTFSDLIRLLETFMKINPFDVLSALFFARIFYIGFRKGALVEFFKFLGVFSATFVTLHYYLRFADFLSRFIALPNIRLELLAFLLLWLIVVLIFKIFQEGFLLILGKREEKGPELVWLALILASLRGLLVCGLLFLALLLTGQKLISNIVQDAKSAPLLRQISVKVYQNIFDIAVKNLFPAEEYQTPGFYL